MPLRPMDELLQDAALRDYAVIQFNADMIEIALAIADAAEDLRAPVIIGVGQGAARAGMLNPIGAVIRDWASRSSLPVCLHLDHAEGRASLLQAIRAGFTSVMIDGSAEPLEGNIALTRDAIEICRPVGMSVEAELGRIPGIEDRLEVSEAEAALVEVETVRLFLDAVHVDALAVAIGSAHGLYKAPPKLDLERLRKIRELTEVPLVLHGGTGIPTDDLRGAIEAGIRKINVGTEVRDGFLQGMKGSAAAGILQARGSGREAVARIVGQKVLLSGAAGKA